MRKLLIIDLLKVLVFLLVGGILFWGISNVLLEKSTYDKYRNYMVQEDVDILILGSSHSNGGIAPDIMRDWFQENKEMNVSIYNYSIWGMRIEQMNYFFKEALKTQTPDVLILETFSFVPIADEHREILARRAFDMLPLSLNKIEAIQYCVNEDYLSYYIPFIKYHTRWKELSSKDIQLLYDETLWENSGTVCAYQEGEMEEEDDYFTVDLSSCSDIQEITPTQEESFEEILETAEEKNIKVILVSVPFKNQLGMDSIEMVKINNYLKDNYVDDENVFMLDMNRMYKELDFSYKDLYNEGHVNTVGAYKVTECLLEYMDQIIDMELLIE